MNFGSARHDENGKYTNGRKGDQTGDEVAIQSLYTHSKGWDCLRAKDPYVRELIAKAMTSACNNPCFGYSQNDRDSGFIEARKVGFDPSKVKTNVNVDCSSLVRICVNFAGISVGDFYTGNEKTILMNTGAFTCEDIEKESDCINGDILVTRVKGHTGVVLDYSQSGWHHKELGWMYYDKGWHTNCWAVINYHWYYFNNYGYALKGYQEINGERFYFETDGDLECSLLHTNDRGALTEWRV